MNNDDIWTNIERLSELRSNYNCFDEKEEPYYHALSNAIQALRKETQGEWVRKVDVIQSIAKQYNEHDELVPMWLSIGDIRG